MWLRLGQIAAAEGLRNGRDRAIAHPPFSQLTESKRIRRDALLLARLLRSADLTPIVVPQQKDEAIRDLVLTEATLALNAGE